MKKIKQFLISLSKRIDDYLSPRPLLAGFLGIVLVLVSFFLGLLAGSRVTKIEKDKNTAFADTVVSEFVTSELYFLGQYFDVNYVYDDYPTTYSQFHYNEDWYNLKGYLTSSLSFRFSRYNGSLFAKIEGDSMRIFYDNAWGYWYAELWDGNEDESFNEMRFNTFNGDYNSASFNYFDYNYGDVQFVAAGDAYDFENGEGYICFQIGGFLVGDINLSEIAGVNITSRKRQEPFESSNYAMEYVYVLEYFDLSGNKIVVVLFAGMFDVNGDNLYNKCPFLSTRTYYFDTAVKNASNASTAQLLSSYNDGYSNGYAAGSTVSASKLAESYLNGQANANQTVTTTSASYYAGYEDGLSTSNASWVLSPINAVGTILNLELFTVGDFTFRLNYLLYLGLGAMFVVVVMKFLFHG